MFAARDESAGGGRLAGCHGYLDIVSFFVFCVVVGGCGFFLPVNILSTGTFVSSQCKKYRRDKSSRFYSQAITQSNTFS